jgi:hypothetical protein
MTDPEESSIRGSFSITDNPSPDKAHDEFFKWVGICIKEWAKIENELFELCKIVLDIRVEHVAIIYYRTPSIESRISLTDDLLKTLWPKQPGHHDATELQDWEQMRNDIRKLTRTRNLLAHAPINYHFGLKVTIAKNGEPVKTSQDTWMEIATSPQETFKTGTRQSIRDTGGDVNMQTHFRDVHAVWDRLLVYRMKLQQAPPSESSPHNPPHPHD